MTGYPWIKTWVEDITDPQWIAVADVAGSSPAVAYYAQEAAKAHANRYDRAAGSVAGLRPQVIASFCRVAPDEIIRVFQAFRDLEIWVDDRIANWSEQQRNRIRLATVDGEPVKDEAAEAEKERRRRYAAAKVARHRARKRAAAKAEEHRVEAASRGQEWLDLPVPWAEKPAEVTPVTPVTPPPVERRKVTKNQTVEAKYGEGYTPQESESHPVSSSSTESVAARDQRRGDSGGRRAPLGECADRHRAPGGGDPWLKARKRDQLVQKLCRYANARLTGTEHEIALNGLLGGDSERGEQWWVDYLDRCMRAEGWDDMAEWRHRNAA